MKTIPGLVLAVLIIVAIYFLIDVIFGCGKTNCEYTNSDYITAT